MEPNQQPPTIVEIVMGYIMHPVMMLRMLYTKWLITRAVSYQMTAQRFIDRSKKMMGPAYQPLPISPTVGQYPEESMWIVEVPDDSGIRLFGMIAPNLHALMTDLTFIPPNVKLFVYDIASLKKFIVEDDELRKEAVHSIARQEKARWN